MFGTGTRQRLYLLAKAIKKREEKEARNKQQPITTPPNQPATSQPHSVNPSMYVPRKRR
jgi:hypothetical protein